ncbi:hypothetical protein GUJ93_ZPchr0008g11583 [Zizania palustris]|uniref:Uncharacterized protein n=1 Tax=Zizania palustris TaxID=103762 RepID=A0A8J5VKE5_ZIZPA|nr:hypothetical protein GUJ93_ZPchr0008g11583 [Zizania palustris]
MAEVADAPSRGTPGGASPSPPPPSGGSGGGGGGGGDRKRGRSSLSLPPPPPGPPPPGPHGKRHRRDEGGGFDRRRLGGVGYDMDDRRYGSDHGGTGGRGGYGDERGQGRHFNRGPGDKAPLDIAAAAFEKVVSTYLDALELYRDRLSDIA